MSSEAPACPLVAAAPLTLVPECGGSPTDLGAGRDLEGVLRQHFRGSMPIPEAQRLHARPKGQVQGEHVGQQRHVPPQELKV